ADADSLGYMLPKAMKVRHRAQGGRDERRKGRREPLQPPRLRHTVELPHDDGQIQSGAVNDEPLGDVLTAAQVQSSHGTGLVHVRERALADLGPLALQMFVPVAPQ